MNIDVVAKPIGFICYYEKVIYHSNVRFHYLLLPLVSVSVLQYSNLTALLYYLLFRFHAFVIINWKYSSLSMLAETLL